MNTTKQITLAAVVGFLAVGVSIVFGVHRTEHTNPVTHYSSWDVTRNQLAEVDNIELASKPDFMLSSYAQDMCWSLNDSPNISTFIHTDLFYSSADLGDTFESRVKSVYYLMKNEGCMNPYEHAQMDKVMKDTFGVQS